jgi:hypothetical protein
MTRYITLAVLGMNVAKEKAESTSPYPDKRMDKLVYDTFSPAFPMLLEASAHPTYSADLHKTCINWLFCGGCQSPLSQRSIWGVQLSKAARALICGHTFTILRVRVVEHALAATSQQSLRHTLWLPPMSERFWVKEYPRRAQRQTLIRTVCILMESTERHHGSNV